MIPPTAEAVNPLAGNLLIYAGLFESPAVEQRAFSAK
jgi:hypothetical protein